MTGGFCYNFGNIRGEHSIKRLLAAALLCAGLARAGFCAPEFTLEAGVNLSSAAPGCVLPTPAGYRMYFSTGPHFAVFSATSTDGVVWGVEDGVRLSTPAGGFYSSSITAVGAYAGTAISSGPYRAYYVGLSSTGIYSVLSATSTDGLAWGRDPDFLMQFGGGSRRVLSLAPYFLGSGRAVLYYVRDNGGAPDPASHRVYAATSSDSGNSFSGETEILSSSGVFHVAISSLTDGTLRLFATASLLGDTTAARVLSADSSDGAGLAFGEPELAFSTNPLTNAIEGLAVTRSTDAYSWRLHLGLRLAAPATTYAFSALTLSPEIYSFSPASVYINDPATDFTLGGEVFSSTAPTVTITKGLNTVPVVSVTRVSDMRLTVRANPNGRPLGAYTVTVTNPDNRSASLGGALRLDFRPGLVAMTDNLFRPLKGDTSKISATIFFPGTVTIKIYDLNGGLVRNLYNGPAGTGATVYTWDGRTDSGQVAASGLYLVRIKGPKTDVKEKIVLIK